MIDKVAAVAARYEELNRIMADPEVATDPDLIREYAQEQSDISDLYRAYQRYQQVEAELDDIALMLEEEGESELRDFAESEQRD
ncbi:MAG: PCRF domain-containing protein, partial [Anaerolineales bacterium]|nr:PCRF domain-containing protein [Anaerolineales bacterium]